MNFQFQCTYRFEWRELMQFVEMKNEIIYHVRNC